MTRRDTGEATVALAVLGAVLTSAPAAAAAAAVADGSDNTIIAVSSVIAAAAAAGTGVGKWWMRTKAKDARDQQMYRAMFGELDEHGREVEEGALKRIKRIDATVAENGEALADHLKNHSTRNT